MRLTDKWVKKHMPRRHSQAHKGDCGRVFILAGSKGMVGAAILSATGAINGGAGLVRLGIVKSQQPLAARRLPLECTSSELPETRQGLLSKQSASVLRRLLKNYRPSVLVIGPGLGQSGDVNFVVQSLLNYFSGPTVLDADGLWALKKNSVQVRRAQVLITPHEGELAKLMGVSSKEIHKDREGWVKKAALKFNVTVILKGHNTLVSDGIQLLLNPTGNSKMASGGMGDVLSGLCGALWAQLPENLPSRPMIAAGLAVYLHGAAGDTCARRSGLSVNASSVAATLPLTISKFIN